MTRAGHSTADPGAFTPEKDLPQRVASRPRVLFIGEGVTLAHTARPLALARAADLSRFDVALAIDPRFSHLVPHLPFRVLPISSIASDVFLGRVAQGRPIFRRSELCRSVEQDLRLIEQHDAEVVVGDLRLSLAISAPLKRVPYVNITNAYWSPFAREGFPVPDLPITKFLDSSLAQRLFSAVRPIAFAWHTIPMNRARRQYGLSPLGFDLRRIYASGDYTLYADLPELVPTVDLPATHRYLGPILWSPEGVLPEWWDSLPDDRPIVYVNLGSSGPPHLLDVVLAALATVPVTVVAATAGSNRPGVSVPNAFVAGYLPGEDAARRSSLVICNGGSMATHQALAAGVPVLGICSNMDQYLNMGAICRAGAGKLLRSARADVESVRRACEELLSDGVYSAASGHLARRFDEANAPAAFWSFVSELVESRSRAKGSEEPVHAGEGANLRCGK